MTPADGKPQWGRGEGAALAPAVWRDFPRDRSTRTAPGILLKCQDLFFVKIGVSMFLKHFR